MKMQAVLERKDFGELHAAAKENKTADETRGFNEPLSEIFHKKGCPWVKMQEHSLLYKYMNQRSSIPQQFVPEPDLIINQPINQ